DCFTVLTTAVADCVRAAQRHGDIDPDADPDDLAYLLLTIIRGTDVVGAYGHSRARLTSIAESAFALLPRPTTAEIGTHEQQPGSQRDDPLLVAKTGRGRPVGVDCLERAPA